MLSAEHSGRHARVESRLLNFPAEIVSKRRNHWGTNICVSFSPSLDRAQLSNRLPCAEQTFHFEANSRAPIFRFFDLRRLPCSWYERSFSNLCTAPQKSSAVPLVCLGPSMWDQGHGAAGRLHSTRSEGLVGIPLSPDVTGQVRSGFKRRPARLLSGHPAGRMAAQTSPRQ